MNKYSEKQAMALATIAEMPERNEAMKAARYAGDIIFELREKGSFELRACDIWTKRVRNMKGGKKLVKEILEAYGVVFTGAGRGNGGFTGGPLVATLKK